MAHVPADFALQFNRLLFGCLGELSLKRIFLPTIPPFFPQTVVAFPFGHGPAFPSLIESDGMNLMLFTPWTVRLHFLRNIHFIHDQLCIKEAAHILILFPLSSLIHCSASIIFRHFISGEIANTF
jgi:hypothetical protein